MGADFQTLAYQHFLSEGTHLQPDFAVDCGFNVRRKRHRFDLGSDQPPVLVECKSHTWTEGHNVPSAKMTTWNEAMLYFAAAPRNYRKILFVLRAVCPKRGLSLLSYYLKTYAHLVPPGVEFIEFDPVTSVSTSLSPPE